MAQRAIAGRCRICRLEVDLPPGGAQPDPSRRLLCEPCSKLHRAPRCLGCGEPVRGADPGDPLPYHQECRRCSSCYQVCSKTDVQKLAGKLLCKCCSHLFGQFFLPNRRSEADHVKEAFEAWDSDGSGSIEASELRRVLKALDPDFADRDVDKLIRTIDKNHNGHIDFAEFTDWIMKGDPLALEGEDGFESFVTSLMQAAGKANNDWGLDIAEVQLRDDGIYFVTEGGDTRLEGSNFRSTNGLELTCLDPEEFITKVEATEAGLYITMNTGRKAELGGTGQNFGPYTADEGFHVVGMRTKPAGEGRERIVGVDMCPLSGAQSYHAPAALRFAAERELLQTLRDILSRSSVDVNQFTESGVTALMLAAQYGNVGAMRLLLRTKADPNLCDQDGWTALTFASRCGQTSAVKILLEKGATQEGDRGHALSLALRQKHNSAARALLRAGFGPSPTGTFAVEESVDPASCELDPPRISPASGNYTQIVNVKLTHAATAQGVKIFYSLDGRDPFLAGRRYRGSLALSSENNLLRVVAVRGEQKSAVAEGVFRVCHYALPDEMVSGVLRVRTFPEVQHLAAQAFAMALEVAQEAVHTQVSTVESSGGKCWMRILVNDPTPAHRLVIDRAFTLVKGETKKKSYLDKFAKDIKRATGEAPENMQVSTGSIVLDFTLPREPAEEMVRQLADPTSYLLKKAKLKTSFGDAEYKRKECLGDRISEPALHSNLHRTLGSRATVDEVIGIGKSDEGIIAICCPLSQMKRLKTPFAQAVGKACQDLGAILSPVLVGPEELLLEYTIDVVNDATVNGGAIVKRANGQEFGKNMMMEMSRLGLCDAEVQPKIKATSRELSNLEFHLEWDFPVKERGTLSSDQDYLDGICMIYMEDVLAQVVDFRSASGDQNLQDGGTSREAALRNRSISRAVQHSGDVMSDTGGQQRMTLDLAALPPDVTDLYFVLAAYDCDDLALFPNPSVEIHDMFANQKMTEYTISSAGSTQAVVMCSLSRVDSKWIVKGLGIPTAGNVRDYKPIKACIARLQVGYGHWERREEIVKLRVLHKLGRMNRGSSSSFATFLQAVMQFPVPIFQLIVQWI